MEIISKVGMKIMDGNKEKKKTLTLLSIMKESKLIDYVSSTLFSNDTRERKEGVHTTSNLPIIQ